MFFHIIRWYIEDVKYRRHLFLPRLIAMIHIQRDIAVADEKSPQCAEFIQEEALKRGIMTRIWKRVKSEGASCVHAKNAGPLVAITLSLRRNAAARCFS